MVWNRKYKWSSVQYNLEYSSFCGAKRTCSDSKSKSWKNYGGRGIKYLYNSFDEFMDDLGPKPSPELTLDRIDNNGNYEKGNCRWASRKKQCNNFRKNILITYKDKTQTVSEWIDELGLKGGIVYTRLQNGESPETAFDPVLTVGQVRPGSVKTGKTKPTFTNILELNGEKKGITEWAKQYNINRHTLFSRLERGWTLSKALGLE